VRLRLPILLLSAVLAIAAWRWSLRAEGKGERVIVAFGDSITQGIGPSGSIRWPDVFGARLAPSTDGGTIAVANRGISGNRLLRDNLGPAGLKRFDRDVLAQRGVAWVIVQIGINDLGFPGSVEPGAPRVTAPQLIDGYQQLVGKARAAGLKVYGCTLLPFEGAEGGFYAPDKEPVRAAVNAWIRSPGAFDAVIDFDAALRDPDHPARMLPAYDTGDHLHPGDRGQQALGEAVDLRLFRP
jgi:lysophospholipase L1-like esterase